MVTERCSLDVAFTNLDMGCGRESEPAWCAHLIGTLSQISKRYEEVRLVA